MATDSWFTSLNKTGNLGGGLKTIKGVHLLLQTNLGCEWPKEIIQVSSIALDPIESAVAMANAIYDEARYTAGKAG